jgi:biopolymer transport protein ExbD
MIKGGGFKKKSKSSSDIPSSSLADMAFLLLIFFMVTTVFPKERKRPLEFPDAEATEKVPEPRRSTMNIYVDPDGSVFINDALTPPDQVSAIVGPQYDANRELVIILRADRDTPYHFVDAVQKELQEARAVRLTFYTELEDRVTRERR